MKKIFLVTLTLLSVIMVNIYFFPSLIHSEEHRGLEYYKDYSYKRFGVGTNRYGKIASNYLPDYSEISKDATYIDFYYNDSSKFAYEYVFVAVGVRYDEKTYLLKKDEIISQSSDFGNSLPLDVYGRLVSQKRRINGETLYYIVEYSDTDKAIMYWVVFSSDNHDKKANLDLLMDDTLIIYTEFWQYLHPITTAMGDFGPKHI